MKFFSLILVLGIMIIQPVLAETIGFVDMQQVFLNYNETQKAREDFEKKQDELRKELESKQALLDKAQKDQKAPEEIEKIIEEIQDELKPKQEALLSLNNQLMAKIRNDILIATTKVAKSYGIDVVMDKQALLYGGFDLTDFVLDDLNR